MAFSDEQTNQQRQWVFAAPLKIDRRLIEEFASGGAVLRAAIEGLSREQLLSRPGPGTWSIQELVIHLADGDAIAIDRMKRVIAEDNPMLLGADERAYVNRLFCDDQSIDDAMALYDLGRKQFARVLRALPNETFDRIGTHNVGGTLTLAQLIKSYVDHLDTHLKRIYEIRRRLDMRVGMM